MILANLVSNKYNNQEKKKLYKILKVTLETIIILFLLLSTVSLARLLHIYKEDIDQTLDNLHSILEILKD